MRFTIVDIEWGAKKLISQEEAIMPQYYLMHRVQVIARTFVEANIIIRTACARMWSGIYRGASIGRTKCERAILILARWRVHITP